jgi:large subunit ribosomal protein L25
VRALAANLPEQLVINVSKLRIGKSIQVGELKFDGLELLNSKNAVVCRVQVTRATRSDMNAADAMEVEEVDETTEGGETTEATSEE